MSILITSRSTKTPGPMININCPACQATEVPADSLQQVDRLELFYLIPFFQLKNTFVTCSACRKQLISSADINEMANLSAADLSQHLVSHVSFVNKAVAILAIAMCWVPIIGLGLGLLGVALNWKTTGWTKTLSLISVIVGAVILGVFFILLAVWGN
jgi:hypothetical protein